jgi:hypothetical protein
VTIGPRRGRETAPIQLLASGRDFNGPGSWRRNRPHDRFHEQKKYRRLATPYVFAGRDQRSRGMDAGSRIRVPLASLRFLSERIVAPDCEPASLNFSRTKEESGYLRIESEPCGILRPSMTAVVTRSSPISHPWRRPSRNRRSRSSFRPRFDLPSGSTSSGQDSPGCRLSCRSGRCS